MWHLGCFRSGNRDRPKLLIGVKLAVNTEVPRICPLFVSILHVDIEQGQPRRLEGSSVRMVRYDDAATDVCRRHCSTHVEAVTCSESCIHLVYGAGSSISFDIVDERAIFLLGMILKSSESQYYRSSMLSDLPSRVCNAQIFLPSSLTRTFLPSRKIPLYQPS